MTGDPRPAADTSAFGILSDTLRELVDLPPEPRFVVENRAERRARVRRQRRQTK